MTAPDTTYDPNVMLWDPRNADAPQAMYQRLREQAPVIRATGPDGVPTVYVTRYQEAMWALRHPEVFSSAPESISIGQEFPLIPLQVDPPNHAKYRRWLDPEFSPKRIAISACRLVSLRLNARIR